MIKVSDLVPIDWKAWEEKTREPTKTEDLRAQPQCDQSNPKHMPKCLSIALEADPHLQYKLVIAWSTCDTDPNSTTTKSLRREQTLIM